MRLAVVLAFAATLAAPVQAGVEEALDDHLLPGFAGFAAASANLDSAARADCTAPALAAPFHAAFDAWLAVGDIRLGPSETGALSIAFWPDTRGFTQKALTGLIQQENPIIDDPEAFSTLSIAGRGLFALEMLLFDPDFADYSANSYRCGLARALTADLADQAKTLERAWAEDFAPVLLSAGSADNARFLSEDEAVRALYTQILAGLQFTTDSRLARPMGSFERPRPARAEARRSGRSLANVLGATQAAVNLAEALADWSLPETRAALERVREAAEAIEDPAFGDVDDPAARFRLEVLQQRVAAVAAAIASEIGEPLGITAGFNAQDGD